jgi:hypothetical protein
MITDHGRAMLATIEMFENPALARDVGKLKEMIYARAEPLAAVEGLRSKVWFNNADAGRFGAFLVWDSPAALAGFRAAEDTDSIAARWGVRPSISDFEIYQSHVDGRTTRP